MYAHLKGQISDLKPETVTLDVLGVGYHIRISVNTYLALKSFTENDSVKIYTHLIVKENEMSLFGFLEDEDRAVFLILIGVSGVGATTALNIQSYIKREEIVSAVILEDKSVFRSVNGIGDKTASQIVLDLKGKFGAYEKKSNDIAYPQFAVDAECALVGLGFKVSAAKTAVCSAVCSGATTIEETIRICLKNNKA